MAEFDNEIDESVLRSRTSEKWAHYPPDILPAFVAETDFPVPPNVARALHDAIDRGDLGYAQQRSALREAFARFAMDRYGVSIAPDSVMALPEVMVGVAEILRVITEPGDGVVINPPVYPPFFSTINEVQRRIVEVPLVESGGTYDVDFDALERAFAAGARVYLFCNPHNPVGRAFSADDVARIGRLAERYGVAVLADEIHAPLLLPGARHTPFETVVAQTGVHAITLTSASKGWNIAGLKCAIAVSSSQWGRSVFERLPKAMTERTGHLGIIATTAAFGSDVAYLDRSIAHLDEQRITLQGLLSDNGLGAIVYAPPQAGFLAWLDCTALGLGRDPAKVFLQRGSVALVPGWHFGTPGEQHVRLNFATSTPILREVVERMRRALQA